MILALLAFKLHCHLNRMAAIFDFINMAAPWGARLGAHQKSKMYDMGDLWAKFGAFGRIWTKIFLTLLTSKNIVSSIYSWFIGITAIVLLQNRIMECYDFIVSVCVALQMSWPWCIYALLGSEHFIYYIIYINNIRI